MHKMENIVHVNEEEYGTNKYKKYSFKYFKQSG